MINGFHTLIYSDDAVATRAFFCDVLGWPNLDAGDGWLIFRTPPAELGVHPTATGHDAGPGDVPTHQTSLMCDDIEATVADLRSKGVAVSGEITDQGFGLVALIDIPGAGWMQLYEPRHDVAYDLSD